MQIIRAVCGMSLTTAYWRVGFDPTRVTFFIVRGLVLFFCMLMSDYMEAFQKIVLFTVFLQLLVLHHIMCSVITVISVLEKTHCSFL